MGVIQQLIEKHGGHIVFDPKAAGIHAPLLEDACWLDVRPTDLAEAKHGDETRYYLNGRLGLVETATANKRLYSRKIMQRELERLAEDMEARGVYGHPSHPKDGRTDLLEVSHYVLGASINEDNEIVGKIEIIPGTKGGDQILAIARTGGRLGVSSRGFGSVVPDDKGNHVVQEDYRLVTWDIVADPANAGAHPTFVSEEKENMPIDINQFIKDNPEAVEALRNQLMDEMAPQAREHACDALKVEFEQQLQEAGASIREEVTQAVRKEFLADPEVAGAKSVVEGVKELVRPYLFSEDENAEIARLNERIQVLESRIAEQDKALQEQMATNNELAVTARRLAYHLFLEHELDEPYTPQAMLSRLGDLDRFETIEAFKDAVKLVQEGMEEELKESREREAALARRDEEIARLTEERNKAIAIGNEGLVRAYLEKRIGRHPHVERVREYVIEAAPKTKKHVDDLIKAYDADHPVSEEYMRLRRGLRGIEEETNGTSTQLNEDMDEDICGVPMSQLM